MINARLAQVVRAGGVQRRKGPSKPGTAKKNSQRQQNQALVQDKARNTVFSPPGVKGFPLASIPFQKTH